jgi:hypothetical protein
MIHSALRPPSLVLSTTVLISLASASAGSAQVSTQAPPQRPSAAATEKGSAVRLHRSTGSTAQAGSRTRVVAHETTTHTARATRSTTVAHGGHWVWLGGRHVWQSYGFTGGGYSNGPVATAVGGTYGVAGVGETYGVAGHSCWWYRHYDPANLPASCPRYYGSSYGYSYSAPSYGYRYGYSAPSYSYSHGYGYRSGVTRTTSTQVTSTRVANANSMRFTSRTHEMAPTQSGAHVAVTRPAETGVRKVGAQARVPSATGTNVRTQTSP